MIRRLEVLRRLLLEIEDRGPLDVMTPDDVGHLRLLHEAGYVATTDLSSSSGPKLRALRITWAGYELLDAIRADAIWDVVTARIGEHPIPLEIVHALARQLIVDRLGVREDAMP